MNHSGAVAELLRRAVARGIAPSAVAVWGRSGDEPRVVAEGRARVAIDPCPAVAETRYDLASLTKPLVTTTLTLLAVRRQALDLELRVGEVMAEAAGSPLAGATISQLLAHSAGLPAWRPLYALPGVPTNVVRQLFAIDLTAVPGDKIEYSCLGFILLGKIVERVLDVPLDLAFRHQVTDPLRLTGSIGFNPGADDPWIAGGSVSPEPEPRMCAELGLRADACPEVGPGRANDGNARFLGGVAGNSGLFGTARAVFTVASQYLLDSTSLLRPEEIAAATQVVASDGQQSRGLGWQLSSTRSCSAGPGLGPHAFGHTGFTGTSVWVDPDLEAIFVLLANRHHPGYHDVDLHPLRRRFHELAAVDLAGG